jgi:uncharacterized protein
MSIDKKLFRDPIYNLISFDKKKEKVILDIINCPEFQRLKRIRQLGLSSYTYPSSVHDRFSHSLGVCYIVGIMFDSLSVSDIINIETINEKEETIIIKLTPDKLKLVVMLAGLLHDIGHGPFSHAFEKITEVDHEVMSRKIISSESCSISSILKEIDDPDLSKYAMTWILEILDGTFKPIWVKELISSQLDADRIDYLLRDAYMCGVNYATFDIKWLFQNIEIGEISSEERECLIIDATKGIQTLEAFIFSRYHMYEQVYFHKTTRGFEIVVQKIFERIKTLMKEKPIEKLNFLNNNLPDFIKNNEDLLSYIALDDYYLITQFNNWYNNSEDLILKKLCDIIVNRKPLKLIKEVKNDQLWDLKSGLAFTKKIGEDNYEHFYFEDDYNNVAYKDVYLLNKKAPSEAEHIWLKDGKGKLKELSEESAVIKSLRNTELKRHRAYISRDLYSEELKKYLK